MSEKEEESVAYPITTDKCPTCGSEERLGKQAMDNLKKEGKLNKVSFPDGMLIPVPLVDPRFPPSVILAQSVRIPVMNIFFDVCAKCRTLFCTRFEIVEKELPVQFIKGPQG